MAIARNAKTSNTIDEVDKFAVPFAFPASASFFLSAKSCVRYPKTINPTVVAIAAIKEKAEVLG